MSPPHSGALITEREREDSPPIHGRGTCSHRGRAVRLDGFGRWGSRGAPRDGGVGARRGAGAVLGGVALSGVGLARAARGPRPVGRGVGSFRSDADTPCAVMQLSRLERLAAGTAVQQQLAQAARDIGQDMSHEELTAHLRELLRQVKTVSRARGCVAPRHRSAPRARRPGVAPSVFIQHSASLGPEAPVRLARLRSCEHHPSRLYARLTRGARPHGRPSPPALFHRVRRRLDGRRQVRGGAA